MIEWILPILAGACMGWGTSWLALKLLFHPGKPRRIGPLRFQGVIARHQLDIAARVGDMVENELLSHGYIRIALESPEVIEGFRDAAHEKARVFAQERLPRIHPLVRLLLTRKMKEKAVRILTKELDALAPGVARSLAEGLESNLPINQLVRERIGSIDLDDLEAVLHEFLDRQSWLVRWGGMILGALMGFVQALLFALVR